MTKIDLLKNHPEAVPQLAHIWHEVLGKIWLPDLPIEYINGLIGSWVNEDSLPLAHVAIIDGEVIGIASLQAECGIRPDLTPWLGSLIVDPKYQKQGIGKMLIDATVQKAKELGFEKLHLFTFDPALPKYYERLGWKSIGMDEFRDHPVTVMELQY